MIRFFKASPFYDVYLDEFYSAHPEMKEASYETQLNAIFNECIAWADFWKINLEKTGRVQAMEVITNARILQQQWAIENGVTYTEEGWMFEILQAQVSAFQPDVFFPHDYFHLNRDFIQKVRLQNPCIRLVIGYDGYGLGDPERFRGTDLMLSCARFISEFYDQHGYSSYFLPFGFETGILDRLEKRPPSIDISFTGSVIVRSQFHNERLRMLAAIASQLPLSLWAASFPQNWQPWKKDQLRRIKQGRYQEFLDVWRLGRINRGSLSGLDMYQCLADSRFTLNHHIDVSGPVAGNSRLTEATGVGTCLVTDWKPNLHEFFDPETEVVSFRTPEEAIEKMRYLSEHEAERRKIAKAGQKRTLTQHTFFARIQEILPVIENRL